MKSNAENSENSPDVNPVFTGLSVINHNGTVGDRVRPRLVATIVINGGTIKPTGKFKDRDRGLASIECGEKALCKWTVSSSRAVLAASITGITGTGKSPESGSQLKLLIAGIPGNGRLGTGQAGDRHLF